MTRRFEVWSVCAVLAAVLLLPVTASAGIGSLRDLGGLDGCLSSGGAADCRPSDSTRGVMEMAFTADGNYVYATSFYDGRIQALKRNATTGKLDPINAPKYSHSCNRYFRPCPMIPMCYGDAEEQVKIRSEMIKDEWSPLSEEYDG